MLPQSGQTSSTQFIQQCWTMLKRDVEFKVVLNCVVDWCWVRLPDQGLIWDLSQFLSISAWYPHFFWRRSNSEKFLPMAEKSDVETPETSWTSRHRHSVNKVSFIFWCFQWIITFAFQRLRGNYQDRQPSDVNKCAPWLVRYQLVSCE